MEGHRIRRPVDAVAQWLLQHHPELRPQLPAAAVLTAIRARTSLVDRMILDEVARARQEGVDLCQWSVGAGLDARWYRMLPLLSDVVVEHRELDTPSLIRLKNTLLQDSPYDVPWSQVVARGLPERRWSTAPRARTRPLVILEGLVERLGSEELQALLSRVRSATPNAVVLLEPPQDPELPWRARHLRDLGWRVLEEVNMAPRRDLVARDGQLVCPGILPVRVLRLEAKLR